MINETEKYEIAMAMKTYGGSFVKLLGEMILVADNQNLGKIEATWPEYLAQYRKMAIKLNTESLHGN